MQIKARKNIYATYTKRVLDIIISITILAFFWWLYIVLAVLVRVNLGAPVFFTQDRPGKDGRIFKLVKYRSMSNAKNENGEFLPDSERLNTFGKLLRATSLDELPEVYNILVGEMSLIGPRPLLKEYLKYYNNTEKRRHEVRPGLTGLAQVSGRNAATWKKRFQMDLEYVDKISFLLDIKIFLLTVRKILVHEGIEYEDDSTINDYFNSMDRLKG